MLSHGRETSQASTIMRWDNNVFSVAHFISSVGVASIYMLISKNNASPDLVVNLVILADQIQFFVTHRCSLWPFTTYNSSSYNIL